MGAERGADRRGLGRARVSGAPRVLVSGVVLDQPMGGVRRHNAELLPRAAELLSDAGGELILMEGKAPIAFELPDKVRVLKSDVPSSPAPVRASFEGRALRSALEMEEAAERPVDLVHLGHLPAPRSLPIPHTHTIHDLRMLTGEHTPMSRRLVSRHVIGAAVTKAARVITVSEFVKRALVEEFGAAEEAVCVVPNGCDHLPVLDRAEEGGFILSVGHLEPRKNVKLLLEALAQDDALGELILVGAPKGREPELMEALALKLGVKGRVRFAGVVSDAELSELYSRCSACVFPSKLEGFGIGVAEAMRAGAPVAIARGTAMDEVAAECCVEFDPEDPADCARALHSALAMTPKALEAARERSSAFSWDASARLLVDTWLAAAGALA